MIEFRPLPSSSRGLGRKPFKLKTGVRISVRAHEQKPAIWLVFLLATLFFYMDFAESGVSVSIVLVLIQNHQKMSL
jgi:hypothetical protein